MVSKINSCALTGIDGCIVEVETDISNGIPSFDIVGLGDTAVRESRERVRASVKNSGIGFPVRRNNQSCTCQSPQGGLVL